MKNSIRLTFIFILVLLYSCNQNQENLLPGVKGGANNIVIVISGPKWEAEPGDIIRHYISDWVPGLPADEPKFDYLFVPHANFDKLYKRQRNILITKIGPDYQEKVLVQHNTWAKSQLVITVMAPNAKAFVELYKKKGDEINSIIAKSERQRLTNTFKANPEKSSINRLAEKHQIKLIVPKGYKVNEDTTNFIWLLNEYRDIIEGVFVYYYPYTAKNTFSNEYLVKKRNEFLKKYVEGEVDGSFMSTEERFPIDSFEYEIDGRYTKELRGLWHMKEGLAMGGPFISVTQYDEERKRIVTAEGFIFAPAHKKRNLTRKVEAIVYSLDFKELPAKQ